MRSTRSLAILGSVLVLVLAAAPALAATAPAGAASPSGCRGTGSTAHRDLRYDRTPGVDPNLQSLDLYVPKRARRCAPAPMVVWVHGGAFVVGDMANQVADKVRLFTSEGWAFASVNYRLVGAPGSGATSGRYPAPEQDIAAALGYLRDRSSRYDLSRNDTMLLGHSAGAYLVALEATDLSWLRAAGVPASSVDCTVALDTDGYDMAEQIAEGGQGERMFRNAFGDDPATWAAASPMLVAATNRPLGDFLLFTRGQADRYQDNVAFRDALRRAGTHADVVRVNPLTHAQVNDAVGQPGDTLVTPPLMRFLRGCV